MNLNEVLSYAELYRENRENENFIVQLRLAIVKEVLDYGQDLKEVAERGRFALKTGYKWIRRYEEFGEDGLKDLPRIPENQPRKTPKDVEDSVLRLKKQNPAWGSRTIRHYLEKPALCLAGLVKQTLTLCHRTVLRILERRGWSRGDKKQKKSEPRFFDWKYPNNLWQMDAKGHFRTVDGKKTHIIDIIDDHSRYCIGAKAWNRLSTENCVAVLEEAFGRCGKPNCLLTDNGSCFTSKEFKKFLRKHGIRHIFTRPNHPETIGKIEAFHKIVDRELLQQVDFGNLAHVNSRMESFRDFYNCQRPHGARGGNTPASDYHRKHEVAES